MAKMKRNTKELRRVVAALLSGVAPSVSFSDTTQESYPHTVFDLSQVLYDSGRMLYTLEVNIVYYGDDSTAADDTADRVQELFDGCNYNGDKISFYTRINTRNNVIEADKSVIRRRLLFELNLYSKEEM
ncbi:MAG: hypothetical protein IJN84_07260 [Clostridia bacterium]|nr:hypothetical protein [Clostridia bacterium]